MKTIEKYLDNNQERFIELLSQSKYISTAKLLSRFNEKITAISSAINTNSTNSFYITALLSRPLIDHILVPYYVLSKFCENQSDDIAKRYFNEYLIGELLKRDNYSLNNNYVPSSKFGKLFGKIVRKLKESKIINEKDLEKYYRAWNEFDIKNISKYIRDEKSEESFNLILKKRVATLLEYFNYFSSYIHGGPSSDISNFELTKDEKEEVIIELKNLAKYAEFVIKIMIAYFLAHENENVQIELASIIEKSMNE